MKRCYRTCITGLIAMVVAGCAASPSGISAPRLVQVAPEPFPYPIVQLHGSADQMGQEQGQLLTDSIHRLDQQYLQKFVGAGTKRFIALTAASVFESKLRPEHREEVHALAEQTQIDEREIMLGQCFLDLAQLSACSTVAVPASASPDHIARFGRNLDFKSLDVADKYTTIFIVHPQDGRYGYASVGWPGMIGTLSGMNEYGLSLANMEVPRCPRFPSAMPYILLYRTVLERCRTVSEAVDLLQHTDRQTANNLMLMDASGDRAVVELNPEQVHVRWGKNGAALISTNHQRDQDTQTRGLCWRYDYLNDQSKLTFGSIDRPEIEKMLGHVGSRTTLQSMVFEPVNRVIYLSAGTGAARKHFFCLDLKDYF